MRPCTKSSSSLTQASRVEKNTTHPHPANRSHNSRSAGSPPLLRAGLPIKSFEQYKVARKFKNAMGEYELWEKYKVWVDEFVDQSMVEGVAIPDILATNSGILTLCEQAGCIDMAPTAKPMPPQS